MLKGIRRFAYSFFYVEPEERLKVILLGIAFFLVIGGYTLARELKNSVFVAVVGREYLALARLGVMIALVPLILLYSRLVDVLRKHQLLYFYSLLYASAGLIFAYFIGHPVIGISNTDTGPHRLFGWFFYLFVEGYSPFVVSVVWAFANSINSPETAKRYYPLIVAGSKFGGVLSAGLAWMLFDIVMGQRLISISGTQAHQILLAFSSVLLLAIPFVISYLMKAVPAKVMHGYEAAYRVEKQLDKEHRILKGGPVYKRMRAACEGMFSGLILLIKQPYILGIFSTIFFYETINVLFELQRIWVVKAAAVTIEEFSGVMFKQIFFVHLVGLLIAMFGTRMLLRLLGERNCLVLIPVSIGVLMTYFLFWYDIQAIFVVYVLLRAINYGFAYPIRESLYIPTVKDIKFKSKSWIDSFGSKLAKANGATCSMVIEGLGPTMFFGAQAAIFSVIIGTWIVSSFLLGKRYMRAVERNEVIGIE